LMKDRSETLLVRPEAGSDLEIPKTRVLAIEEATRCHSVFHALALLKRTSSKDTSIKAFSPQILVVNRWRAQATYPVTAPEGT
jgi:hypothetical protein